MLLLLLFPPLLLLAWEVVPAWEDHPLTMMPSAVLQVLLARGSSGCNRDHAWPISPSSPCTYCNTGGR
jgi:hypothetical protein